MRTFSNRARTRTFRTAAVAATAAAMLALAGCSSDGNTGASEDNDALTVYATTGYLADAVANIAPEAEVTTMVGPGGDPHTYQPTTEDIETMRDADVVLWNGLHLEAQMIDQLESLGDKQLAVGEKLNEDQLLPWPDAEPGSAEQWDPHIWNSPHAWSDVVDFVAEHLGTIDPDNADTYQQNADAYQEEIMAAHEEAESKLAELSAPRILVSGHDAFNYLGDTYDLEVHATDFVSSEANLSAEELSDLADLIADNEIPVIFQDNQSNPQAVTSLQEAVHSRGWDVEVSDEELYADSLGAEDNVDTYLEVYEHNTTAIAEALS